MYIASNRISNQHIGGCPTKTDSPLLASSHIFLSDIVRFRKNG